MNNSTPKKIRFKRQQWNIGDYFLIPLLNEKYSIGQIVGFTEDGMSMILAVFFGVKVNDEAEALNIVASLGKDNVVGRCPLTLEGFDWYKPNTEGYYKIFAHGTSLPLELFFDMKRIKKSTVGMRIYGTGNVQYFMNAYYALIPWDESRQADYLDKILASPDKKPKHLILSRKQQPWQAGDCFLVPLIDGSYGIGQVIGYRYVQPYLKENPSWINTDYISCICFEAKVQNRAAALKLITKLTKKNIIGATLDDRYRLDWIEPSYWEVFYHTKPLWTNLKFENFNRHLAGVEKFLNAFYALIAWDSDYGGCVDSGDWENKIECVLISEDKKPKNLKYLCKNPPAPKIVPKRPKWLVELDKERRKEQEAAESN